MVTPPAPSFPSALGCLILFLLPQPSSFPKALRICPSAQTKDEPKIFSLSSILQLFSRSWEIRAYPSRVTGNPEWNFLNPGHGGTNTRNEPFSPCLPSILGVAEAMKFRDEQSLGHAEQCHAFLRNNFQNQI